MAYHRNFRRPAKPSPRVIVVKYDGVCACCAAPIKAGETATYYPPGTIASVSEGKIAHIGALDGTSARCTANLRADLAVNSYAGDGLDQRWEDAGAEICGR